jgi:hypothetical protein
MEIIIRKMEKSDAHQLAHLQEVVFPDLIPGSALKPKRSVPFLTSSTRFSILMYCKCLIPENLMFDSIR